MRIVNTSSGTTQVTALGRSGLASPATAHAAASASRPANAQANSVNRGAKICVAKATGTLVRIAAGTAS